MTQSPWPPPRALTPSTGPLPPVDWIDYVDTDPVRALEMLVLGW
jgi:hypothetical protein